MRPELASDVDRWCRRAAMNANPSSTDAQRDDDHERLVTAQPGSAPAQHVERRAARPRRGRRRGARRPCRRASPTARAAVAGCALSTATRASSPIRAGQHRVREQPDAEGREDVAEARVAAAASPGSITVRHATARTSTESEVERDRERRPSSSRRSRTRPRPRPSSARATRSERRARRARRATSADAHPAAASERDPHAAAAGTRVVAGDQLVDPGEPRRDPVPGVALARELARGRPERAAAASSSSSAITACASASGSPGGTGRPVSRRHHLAVAGDVGGDRRRRARERAREHHPEALAAERGRDERLRAEQLLGQLVLREEAEHVDPARRTPSRDCEQRDGERVGADEAQPRAGRAVDLRPGAQQHVQALPRLLPADEDDAVLAAAGIGVRPGSTTPFGTISYSPGNQRGGRVARLLRDGDPVVDPVEQEAPGRHARASSSASRPDAWKVATTGQRASARAAMHGIGVIGSCRWRTSKRSRSSARRMRQIAARAEDDVRQRAVRGHDHRAADRDHVGRAAARGGRGAGGARA